MKQTTAHWQVAGFIFTAILGTFLHFLFDWSKQNIVAALFSAVNESIWEHMKLLYYPMFIFALIENRFLGKQYDHFWCVKLIGSLLGILLIPTFYYTYTGILGSSADWFNIAIFFIVAGIVFWSETKLFKRKFACRISSPIAFILMCLIGAIFTFFTFLPPHIPLFADPISGSYGFSQG